MADNQQTITDNQRQQAKLIWHYHQMHHDVRPADAAIGLGTHDLGVPTYCAQLYRAGLFPTLVFSGGPNPTAPDQFPRGEALHFQEHAIELGVPADAILVEPKARNTGQNISFSRDMMHAAGITPDTVLLISTPYMERRSFATARKLWPEVDVICTSQSLDFDDYLKTIGDEKLVTNQLVGDLQRVIEYPQRGFAIEQDVPEDVYAAYESLIHDGFTHRLLTP